MRIVLWHRLPSSPHSSWALTINKGLFCFDVVGLAGLSLVPTLVGPSSLIIPGERAPRRAEFAAHGTCHQVATTRSAATSTTAAFSLGVPRQPAVASHARSGRPWLAWAVGTNTMPACQRAGCCTATLPAIGAAAGPKRSPPHLQLGSHHDGERRKLHRARSGRADAIAHTETAARIRPCLPRQVWNLLELEPKLSASQLVLV
jgi:hypothetical protein